MLTSWDTELGSCVALIHKMYDKYQDNPHMLKKIHTHITSTFPSMMESEDLSYEKRQNLYTYLTEEKLIFMQVFLSKHNYYYLSSSGLFYEYDGRDYYIVREDEVIHKILSTISKERTLMQWKHKTKKAMIRQIKDRPLFSCIPETETIQQVLNHLYPAMFSSKSEAKYFLTIIGDNLLKKVNDNIYLVSQPMRKMLDDLDDIAAECISNGSITQKMVTKYHESHTFPNCRLLKINRHFTRDYWRDLLKKIGLNLVCVAAHYSTRYSSADQYLETKADEDVATYAGTLKHTTEHDLVERFIGVYLESTTSDLTIEWKNIHFIWKQFLADTQLPTVIYSKSLKTMLRDRLRYDETTDTFVGVTSRFLPAYREFIEFWSTTTSETPTSTNGSTGFEHELEIDEICSMFKRWSNTQHMLTEESILRVLKHYFNIKALDNKYVINVTSSCWDKYVEVRTALEEVKRQVRESHSLSLISFDDLYTRYLNLYAQAPHLVSKRYFEKYLVYNHSEYIVYDKFMEIEWANTSSH